MFEKQKPCCDNCEINQACGNVYTIDPPCALQVWKNVSDINIPPHIPVLGFSIEWIDEDFNPDGIRECFIDDDGKWISAKWFDYQDTYTNDERTKPTHCMPLPPKPY